MFRVIGMERGAIGVCERDRSTRVSRRKALAQAGISGFEGTRELEFASFYSLSIKNRGEEAKAENSQKLAEQKSRLAEKRLKAAESDDLGGKIGRATWVALFLKEV
ncbi:MAG: hypothetical protein M1828_002411, partial [Chrysothrix sp. TS-e1954]